MASFTLTARCPTKAVAGRRVFNRGFSGVRLTTTRPQFIVRAVDESEVFGRVQEIVKEQLALEETPVSTTKFADLKADSLDIVEVMMALEEEFGIDLDEGEAEEISTVGDAATLIAAEVASKTSS
ncbi:hypothetical protein BSKO_07846 [Bryopsis sp. KO-2023]|nr:hypothetical protein BSKO_07846 [Bryopsis sp. KO-2023]